MIFTVSLNHPVATGLTVQYTTRPGTAKSALDYTAKTKTLTFQPNQAQKTIGIQIKTGDHPQRRLRRRDRRTHCMGTVR
jgi:hypothetical protein